MRLSFFTRLILLFATGNLAGQALQITEFMADPNPVVGLPEAEYVELLNSGEDPLDVSTLRVASGGGAVDAGAGPVPLVPGAYLVLVPEEYADSFSAPGIRVVPMPLPGLSNRGDEITIYRGSDTVARIVYDEGWYADGARDGGGYSLEYTGQGDPGCGGNWRASRHPDGGTPGRENSVFGQVVDTLAPTIVGSTIDSAAIIINFSEPVTGSVFVSVDGAEVEALAVDRTSFSIRGPFVKGVAYGLRVFADYSDCAGNFPPSDTLLSLLYAGEPQRGDLVINEILFNPPAGGSDYLELFNNGLEAIDLRGLIISNSLSNSRPRTIASTLILPAGDYLVLTSDRDALLEKFPNAEPGRVVTLELPAFPNRSGNVTITAPSGVVVDAFDYSEDYHAELLNTVEGVSLERIDPAAAGSSVANWASAGSASGFGTPTRRNSQFGATGPGEPLVRMRATETVFSPDGDGVGDRYVIDYSNGLPNALARLRVYDVEGRPVLPDSDPQFLGRQGELTWNGRGTNGARVPPGPYVILVEVNSQGGYTLRKKLVAVVAPSR